MTIARLKAKNQVTLPAEIIKRLGLKADELFAVDVEENYLKLTPVKLEPKYNAKELEAIDSIVEREKPKAKIFTSAKVLRGHLRSIR
jgi:bifunctional DNA-binding transcriptional regulator/antitoxin component of YhaV-PrlF toxin-antitoxin module